MLKIKLTEDLGKKQLEDKWKGKFLDDSCYQKVIKIKEDTAILKPIPSLDGSRKWSKNCSNFLNHGTTQSDAQSYCKTSLYHLATICWDTL